MRLHVNDMTSHQCILFLNNEFSWLYFNSIQILMNALKQCPTVSLEPHVSMVMEVSLVPVQLVSLEMADRVVLVVQVITELLNRSFF